MFLRKIFYALPPSWRFLARRAWYWPQDFFANFLGKNSPLPVPPKGMIFTGSGDFERDGRELVANFAQFAGLLPEHHVLDVGSGIGRVALPLTQFLNEKGRYDGFDPVPTGVAWCQQNISSRWPNFQFRHVPLHNDLYTDAGGDAAQFTFPYPDAVFDFACVISVFTHMLPGEVARYLDELHRTLRPGGTVFATFFILNDAARPDGNPAFAFPHVFENHALMDKKVQAGNVAFREEWLLAAARNFELVGKHYGFWSGRTKAECLNFQDVLVLRKK